MKRGIAFLMVAVVLVCSGVSAFAATKALSDPPMSIRYYVTEEPEGSLVRDFHFKVTTLSGKQEEFVLSARSPSDAFNRLGDKFSREAETAGACPRDG